MCHQNLLSTPGIAALSIDGAGARIRAGAPGWPGAGSTSRPVFWTREQRGEEASSWLFFRHKLDYLRLTSHRFGSRGDPVVRDFCIPEETVHTSPPAERVLVLLAAALMESLGIRTQVCTDPQLSTVDGFVLAPGTRAVIATWVRTDGRWHVDSTASRSVLTAFGDVTREAAAYQIRDAPSPVERLTALASYLGLDWAWITRRCRELSCTLARTSHGPAAACCPPRGSTPHVGTLRRRPTRRRDPL